MISWKREVVIKCLKVPAKETGQQAQAPEKGLLWHEGLQVYLQITGMI